MADTIQRPVATAQMLIRRPVAQVFEAWVDPTITRHFWFSKGSGRLEAGKRITWEWEMYGFSTELDVKEIEENRRILIDWGVPNNPTSVEWTFEPKGEGRTFVTVKNWGFSGDPDKVVEQAIGSAGGFSFVLSGLKAYLEHGIELNLIVDHDPAGLREGWE